MIHIKSNIFLHNFVYWAPNSYEPVAGTIVFYKNTGFLCTTSSGIKIHIFFYKTYGFPACIVIQG